MEARYIPQHMQNISFYQSNLVPKPPHKDRLTLYRPSNLLSLQANPGTVAQSRPRPFQYTSKILFTQRYLFRAAEFIVNP